jgi:hypothetical protein
VAQKKFRGHSSKAPKESADMVPLTDDEHKEMMCRMTMRGSIQVETEQIIGSCRTAFNKVTPKFKKIAAKTPKWSQQKFNKNSNNVVHRSENNGN